MLEAARRAKRALAVGYQLRHHAAHAQAKRELRERVGELVRIEARWAWPDPATQGWRARGQGARYWSLAALGTHLIDLALWYAGDVRVTQIAADVVELLDLEDNSTRRLALK